MIKTIPTKGSKACLCSLTLNSIAFSLVAKADRSIEKPSPISVEKRGSETQPVRAISDRPILAKATPVAISNDEDY